MKCATWVSTLFKCSNLCIFVCVDDQELDIFHGAEANSFQRKVHYRQGRTGCGRARSLVFSWTWKKRENVQMMSCYIEGNVCRYGQFPNRWAGQANKNSDEDILQRPTCTRRPKALGLRKNFGPKSRYKRNKNKFSTGKCYVLIHTFQSWPNWPLFQVVAFSGPSLVYFKWFFGSLKMQFEKPLKVTNLVPVQ